MTPKETHNWQRLEHDGLSYYLCLRCQVLVASIYWDMPDWIVHSCNDELVRKVTNKLTQGESY